MPSLRRRGPGTGAGGWARRRWNRRRRAAAGGSGRAAGGGRGGTPGWPAPQPWRSQQLHSAPEGVWRGLRRCWLAESWARAACLAWRREAAAATLEVCSRARASATDAMAEGVWLGAARGSWVEGAARYGREGAGGTQARTEFKSGLSRGWARPPGGALRSQRCAVAAVAALLLWRRGISATRLFFYVLYEPEAAGKAAADVLDRQRGCIGGGSAAAALVRPRVHPTHALQAGGAVGLAHRFCKLQNQLIAQPAAGCIRRHACRSGPRCGGQRVQHGAVSSPAARRIRFRHSISTAPAHSPASQPLPQPQPQPNIA